MSSGTGGDGWAGAWAMAQRLGAGEPDAAGDCAAKLRGTEAELTTGLAALAWAAPDLPRPERSGGVLADAITAQLNAGGQRADLTAAACHALAASGLELARQHEALWQHAHAGRGSADSALFALQRVARHGHALPALRDRLISDTDQCCRRDDGQLASAAWRGQALSDTDRAWWTRRLVDPYTAKAAARLLGGDVDNDALDKLASEVAAALASRAVRTVTSAIAAGCRLLPWRSAELSGPLVTACAHPKNSVGVAAGREVRIAMRRLAVEHPPAAATVLAAAKDAVADPVSAGLARDLAQYAVLAGDEQALAYLGDDGPPACLAWLRGDRAGLAEALQADPAAGLAALYEWSHPHWDGDLQSVAEAATPHASAEDVLPRIVAIALLARAAGRGADIAGAVGALTAALADHRKPKGSPVMGAWISAPVSWWAATALGACAAEPARDALTAALRSRKAAVRHCGAFGLGIAASQAAGFDALAAVLDRGDPGLAAAAAEGVTRHASGRAAELVAWMAGHGFDPALCFRSPDAFADLAPYLRVTTRPGLGMLLNGLASPQRHAAMEGLAAAACHGDDIGPGVELLAGAVFCGDWPVPDRTAVMLLHKAVAGRPQAAAGIVRWMGPFLAPDAPACASAAAIVLAAVQAGADAADLAGALAAVAAAPFGVRPGHVRPAQQQDAIAASRSAAASLAIIAAGPGLPDGLQQEWS